MRTRSAPAVAPRRVLLRGVLIGLLAAVPVSASGDGTELPHVTEPAVATDGADEAATADEAAAARLRVLAFNVRSARGADTLRPVFSMTRLRTLAEMIAEYQPDAVLLQELDRGVARSKRVDQYEFLRGALGMKGRYAHAVDYQGGSFGIAAFTAHEIVSYNEVRLPRLGGKEPRVVQHMRITLPNGSTVELLNTHIDPRLASRDRQIELVLQYAAGFSDRTTILAGDFNAPPSTRIMERVSGDWDDAAAVQAERDPSGRRPTPTYPAAAPLVRVDYIFYRGPALRLTSLAQPDNRGVSDHLPLLAEFAIEP
jgi:endonuclease/exonuclease/phosphatase family metal-dependent hydrolase